MMLHPFGLGSSEVPPSSDLVNHCSSGFWKYVDPLCWGFNAEQAAAQKLVYPDDVYVMPKTVPPPSPEGDVLTTPPASGEDAQATIDALLAQQMREQQAENQRAMNATAQNLKSWTQSQCPGQTLKQQADGSWACPSSIPTWLIIAGAAGIALVLLTGGKR